MGKRGSTTHADDTGERYKKLVALGKDAYVSRTGIWKLLRNVAEEGLPEAYSRTTQWRARKAVCSTATPYGKLVVQKPVTLKNGKCDTIAIQNPLAMLYHSCHTSASYSSLMRARLEAKPPTPAAPWNLIVYQDGVDPSDGLAKNHSRKCVVFYWSFLELGMAALAHEEVWNTATVVRQNIVNQMEGQHVQVADLVLKSFFDPEGHDILRSGVNLAMHESDETCTVFAKLGVLLADEPALKELLACKGHAGTKPCPLCMNVVLQCAPGGGEPLHLHSEYAVSIAETDSSRFKLHTDESLRALVLKLHGYKDVLTKAEFELREQLFGFNWTPHSLILNERLRLNAVSCLMFDWSHCYVCDGIADAEFGTLMKRLHTQRSATTYQELGSYVEAWTFPAHRKLGHLFSESASKANLRKGAFNCTASEFLTLAPVLARYLSTVCMGRGQDLPLVRSMLAVLVAVEVLQAVKRGVVAAETLSSVIVHHIELYVEAYGADSVRPKHHFVQHLPAALHRFGTLLGTLTNERKHRVVKRFSRGRMNLRGWELGTVEDVTCQQLFETSRPFMQSGQTDSKAHPRALMVLRELHPGHADEDFTLHTQVQIDNGTARSGDAVLVARDGNRELGELLMSFSVQGRETKATYSALGLWRAMPLADDQAMAPYRVDDCAAVVLTSALQCACTHRLSQDRTLATVYLPYEYRC